MICPAPLAEALELKKGETLQFVIEDKMTIRVKRIPTGRVKS